MHKNSHKSDNANKYENHTSHMPYDSFLFFPFNTYHLLMQKASVFCRFILLVYAFLDGTPAGTKELGNEIQHGAVARYSITVLGSVSGCCQASWSC